MIIAANKIDTKDKISNNPIDDKIKKSLKYSILDGTFYSMMVGFGESFFSAFAIFLKATNFQLGLLGSLPQALGFLSQLFSNKLIKYFNSRKKFICIGALLEALMYIPIALVFFLGEFKVFHLILFVCIYWIFGTIINPAWSSWIGELVDEKKRGAYFGRRNKIAGFASFISLLIGGYVLQHFTDGIISQYLGFAAIFLLALIARIISFIFLTRKYEPTYRGIKETQLSFFDFIKQARLGNYGWLISYLSLMNFSVFVSGPFFAAYMLYDLKLNYLTFTIINVASLIVKYLAMPIWGKYSDRFGTRKILSLAGFLMPVVPLLWLFSKDVYYLIIIQMFSGFVWAGFELASFNFIFDTTTSQRRATYVAYYNVFNGVAVFLGAMVGSIIIKYNHIFWSKYLLVFLISCILRYIISFIFIPKLQEMREVEHIPYHELLFKIITTMPTMGMINYLTTFGKNNLKINIKRGKKYKNIKIKCQNFS